jgi:tape measure domain-containing protein
LLDGTRKMVAFGMEADTSLVVIDAIANAVAAMGGGAQEIDTLADVFAKITSNGRLTMMEINRLGDQGINALKILANQYGVTVEEMSKMVSAGAVDGETAIAMLIDGIMNGTEGVNGATVAMAGSLDKIKGTWKGTMDSLIGAWRRAADAIITDEMFAKIGDSVWKLIEVIDRLPELVGPLVERIADFLMGLMDGISKLVDWFFSLSPATQQMIVQFVALLVATGPLLIIIGQIGLGVSALIGVFGFLLSPVGLIIAAIVALVAIFIYFWNTNEGFRDALIAAWEQLKEAGMAIFEAIRETIAAVAAAIKAIWEEHGEAIMAVLKPLWEQVKNTVTTAIEIIKNVIIFVMAIIRGDWSAAWEALKNIGVAIWDYMKNTATNIFEALKASLSLIWAVIREQAIAIWENIKQGVIDKANALRQGVIDTVDRALQWIRELPGKAIAWGRDLIQGFIDGILGKAAELYGKIKGVIDGAISAAKNALKSDSPSKVFENIGIDTVKGYIQGLEKMAGAVNVGLSGMVNPGGGMQPAMAGAGPQGGAVGNTFNLRGLFEGAHITIGSEADAKSLAREIYNMAGIAARAQGDNI